MSIAEEEAQERRDWEDGRASHHLELEAWQRDRSALYSALVPALGELAEIAKTKQANAGQYSYTYADLADLLTACRPVLATHGLAISQRVTTSLPENTVSVSTRILHVSGDEYYAGRMTFPLGRDAQATGSLISYARRYALLAALGIAAEDDDGAAASARPPTAGAPETSSAAPPRPPRLATKAQMAKIGALMDDAGLDSDAAQRRELVAGIIGRTVRSRAEMTQEEAGLVVSSMQAVVDGRATVRVEEGGGLTVARL